eukprot:gene906-10662_t
MLKAELNEDLAGLKEFRAKNGIASPLCTRGFGYISTRFIIREDKVRHASSDANPKHTHCPPGATSWSFWQRDLAKSNSPGSHKAHDTLSPDVAKKIVPIF